MKKTNFPGKDKTVSRLRSLIGLPASNEWLEAVMKASPVGVGILVDRTILSVNDELCRLLGYRPGDMIGKNSRFLYASQEEYERVGHEKYIDIVKTGSGTLQTVFIKKDKTLIDVQLSSTAIDKNDLKKGLVFTVNDLTRVTTAEKKYSELFELSPEAMIILDQLGNITNCNQAFYRLTDMQKEELVGRHFTQTRLFTANELPAYITLFSSLLKTKKKQTIEFSWTHRDASIRMSVAHLGPILKNNEIVGIQAIIQDITEQRKTELRIRENEELNRNIIQTAFDGFLSINPDGDIIDVNEAYCHISGYSREELLRMKVTDLVAGMTPGEVKEKMLSIASRGQVRFENVHRRKDGNDVDVEIYASFLNLRGGIIVAFIKDITDFKINEKILDTRFELMANTAAKSIDELLRYCLDRTEELTSSRIGFFHFIAEDQKTILLQAWSSNTLSGICKTAVNGSHYDIERAGLWVEAVHRKRAVIHNDYKAAEGRKGLPEGHVDLSRHLVVPIFEGQLIKAIIGVGNKDSDYTKQDIEIMTRLGEIALTIFEKKRAEEELKETNYWLNEAQRISNSGYYSFNFKDQTWSASSVLNNILGIDQDYNKTLASYFELLHPEHREQMSEYVRDHVVRDKNPFDRQYLIKRPCDGVSRWVHGLGQTVYDENGEPAKIVGTIRDITEQKLAEFSLIEAKEKAEESDRLKSTFLATMSHELRTPLNAVIGFSSLIKEESDINSIQEMNRYISENGYRLLKIIESIFDISMLETRNARVLKETFSAADFFMSINQVTRAEIDKYDRSAIEVVYDPDPVYGDITFESDRLKLTQLITNLVNNALRYTDSGTIKYGFRIDDDRVIFFVSDTGIGIASEMQGIIFDKFRQVDESHTRSHDGVGLGLAICKEISYLLNGKLWVESEVGTGSVFYFEIDGIIGKKRSEGERTSTAPGKLDLAGKTILVAEDVESNYLFLEKLLQQLNARVLWAHNGIESLDMVNQYPEIELVMMDIRMPAMNGYDATREIKKLRGNLPVIAQTAYAMKEDEKRAMEAGCDNYIAKPFNSESLVILLGKYFS